jgi:hypothetical protein
MVDSLTKLRRSVIGFVTFEYGILPRAAWFTDVRRSVALPLCPALVINFAVPNEKFSSALVRFLTRSVHIEGNLTVSALSRIVLQKSFSTADQNFSSPLMRFADKYVRDLVSS